MLKKCNALGLCLMHDYKLDWYKSNKTCKSGSMVSIRIYSTREGLLLAAGQNSRYNWWISSGESLNDTRDEPAPGRVSKIQGMNPLQGESQRYKGWTRSRESLKDTRDEPAPGRVSKIQGMNPLQGESQRYKGWTRSRESLKVAWSWST